MYVLDFGKTENRSTILKKLPSPVPMNMTELPKYFEHRDAIIAQLNAIGNPTYVAAGSDFQNLGITHILT